MDKGDRHPSMLVACICVREHSQVYNGVVTHSWSWGCRKAWHAQVFWRPTRFTIPKDLGWILEGPYDALELARSAVRTKAFQIS